MMKLDSIEYLKNMNAFYTDLTLQYCRVHHIDIINQYFEKLQNVSLRKIGFYEDQNENEVAYMMGELMNRLSVSKVIFHPKSSLLLHKLTEYNKLQSLTLLLSNLENMLINQICYPESLESLELDYYDEQYHQKFLLSNSNIKSLTLECAKIFDMTSFANVLSHH